MDSVRLKLKAFEGPLDLLCHLIQVNKIDIYDIPIVDVTRQYLAHLSSMQHFHMDVASEFLVMAATLMEIKSRTLLPASRSTEVEEGETELEDPREELVAKIIEYQRFKQAAHLFKQSGYLVDSLYFKPPEDLTAFLKAYGSNQDQSLPEVEVAGAGALVQTFQSVMRAFLNSRGEEKEKPIHMARELYTISGQMKSILAALNKNNPLPFKAFFFSLNDRQKMIVTFLSLLELMRTGQVTVREHQDQGDLVLVKVSLDTQQEMTGA